MIPGVRMLREWLNVRIGLDEIVREQLTEYRVPKNLNPFYSLGFVLLAAFSVQILTGILLLIYYIPHSDHAFGSVQKIMTEVPYGWLFRQMHAVGSNLIVAVLLVHMTSVFFMGSYKKPRELTWVVGNLMLQIALAFCLSGYLLPWSQLSYWATTIVTNIPTAFPVVGETLARVLRGGDAVSGVTLNRFFAAHVALLPLLLLGLIGLHLFLVRRIGISEPPFGPEKGDARPWTRFHHEDYPDGMRFFPDYVLRDLVALMVYFAVMFFVIGFAPTLFFPDAAIVPADPLSTPAHIKPEWYFLAPYQMLRTIPSKFLGVSLQIFIVTVMVIWPFLDFSRRRNILRRPFLLLLFLVTLAGWIGLTIWGHYS